MFQSTFVLVIRFFVHLFKKVLIYIVLFYLTLKILKNLSLHLKLSSFKIQRTNILRLDHMLKKIYSCSLWCLFYWQELKNLIESRRQTKENRLNKRKFNSLGKFMFPKFNWTNFFFYVLWPLVVSYSINRITKKF